MATYRFTQDALEQILTLLTGSGIVPIIPPDMTAGPKFLIHIRAPEYDEYENLDSWIAIADSMTGDFSDQLIGNGALGTIRDYAVALRTLHMICKRENRDGAKVGSGQGVAGSIGSETEGNLSRQYRTSKDMTRKYPDLMTTMWGQELVSLIQSCYGVTAMTRISL